MVLGFASVANHAPDDLGGLVPADEAIGDEPACWALVVIWCDAEPERVGQTLLLPAGPGESEVGRGMGEPDRARVLPICQNPGINEPAESLSLPEVSRTQLRLRVDDADVLTVRNVGRCAMRINGIEQRQATLAERDVLELRDQIAFVCVRRPELIPASRVFPASHAPSFGEADGFGVVGESPGVWMLRDSMAYIAVHDDHVLVLGGHGSGMMLVARAIHALSGRSRRPLEVHRAGSLREGIGDAELLGHAAGGGTLVLEHVHALPAATRVRLIGILDRGGADPGPTDPRLLATTVRDFGDLAPDLMARFGLRLWVPPIRERCEDVPLLVRSILGRLAADDPGRVERFMVQGGDGRWFPRMEVCLVEALVRHDYEGGEVELEALLGLAIDGSVGDRLRSCPELEQALQS